MDWPQNHQRRPDQRPQCKCYELRQVHSRHGRQYRPEEIPGGSEDTSNQCVSARAHTRFQPMCKPCMYTRWRRSLSWLAGLFSMRPLSSAATISQKPYLATVAKPRWMKRNGMTLPLKSIKETTHNTKRIAHSYWTGLQNKIGKRIKRFTISKIPTKPWPSTTKPTEQK